MRFRTLPINLKDQNTKNVYAEFYNTTPDIYKAVQQIDLELSPKIYDFTLTGAEDRNWESYFSKPQSNFYTGTKDYRGEEATTHKHTLPLMPNKNDQRGYESYGLKLGYEFSYNITTNGAMKEDSDIIVIKPSYWHVDKEGKNRQEVDVYYTTQKGFVKLGGPRDTMANNLVLNQSSRGVTQKEIDNTIKALLTQDRGEGKNYTKEEYYGILAGGDKKNIKYKENIVLTNYQKTYIGTPGNQPDTISDATVIGSKQKWYGEMLLPNTSLFVPKGTDLSSYDRLTTWQEPFISGGYIIVNFEIEVYKKQTTYEALDSASPYITYKATKGNQWAIEGYDTSQGGMTLSYGDVAVYHVDKKASDDYK